MVLTFWDIRQGDLAAMEVLNNLHSTVLREAIELAARDNNIQAARSFSAEESLWAMGTLLHALQHLQGAPRTYTSFTRLFWAPEVF